MNLAEVRQKYPQYNDMSDEQLSLALEKKYTSSKKSGMSMQDIMKKTMPVSSPLAFGGGLLSGLNDVARGANQLLTKGAEATGIAPEGAEGNLTKFLDSQRSMESGLLSGAFPENGTAINVGRFTGEALPYAAIPALRAATLPAKIAGGAGVGAGIGATQYVPEGDSRLKNTMLGGMLGGAVPAVGAGLTSAPVKNLLGAGAGLFEKAAKHIAPDRFEHLIAKDVMTGIDAKAALKAKKEADKLGINLTPAEASGSQTAMNAQQALGSSKGGQEALSAFQRERGAQERNSIDHLMKKISPSKKDAGGEIRESARNVIDKEIKHRQKSAEPFYEASEKTLVPKEKLIELQEKYPVIADAYEKVLKNKAYASEIKGASPDSIKVVDLVKRRLDDEIEKLKKAGGNNEARLYKKAKTELVNAADEASLPYKIARGIYEEGSRSLEKIKGSDIQRIAKLPDHDLQKVSKILLDRNETNPKVLAKLRDTFVKENPAAWRQIMRNEMERRLSHMEHGASGTKFYNAMLKNDADFNQFLIAAKGMPDVQKNLISMRPVFKNLMNGIRDKNIITNEASVQSIGKEVGKAASKAAISGYDKKAIEIITSGKWDKYLRNIEKTKDKTEKSLKLGKLLGLKPERAAIIAVTGPREPKKEEK